MSAPIRFLGLAILTYAGLRTASSALAVEPIAALSPTPSTPAAATAETRAKMPPPGVAADMGPPPAYAGAYGTDPYPPSMAAGMLPPGVVMTPQGYAVVPYPIVQATMPVMRAPQTYYVPAPYPVPASTNRRTAVTNDEGRTDDAPSSDGYARPLPPLADWPAIGTIGSASVAGLQRTPGWGKGKDDGAPIDNLRPKRWSVDAWALLRQPRQDALSFDDPGRSLNPGLASAGALGGSQAGMRITWRPLNRVGVHVRASTALLPQGRSGQSFAGGEGALGVSWQPLRNVPVRVLAERRQLLGDPIGGGRNAFAFLMEGGLYGKTLPFGLQLDGYGQAGVVGLSRRDYFADGALTATYPFMPRLSFGAGMWGGVQPGLSRFDAGPRLSYQLRPGLRAHVDYRFRVTGNADPGSGPAVTLAAGF